MKRIALILAASSMMAAPALAADVIYDAPAFEPAAPVIEAPVSLGGVYSWTGAYVGAIGGLGTSQTDIEAFENGPAIDPTRYGGDVSGGGGLIGAQAGYDFQVGDFVVGVVADIAKTNIKSDLYGFEIVDFGAAGTLETSVSARSKLDYVGTVRGRLGYAFDRLMVYGHGGVAYGETKQDVSVGFVDRDAAGNVLSRGSEGFRTDSGTKTGYSVGAGLEYAVFDNVSVQTEYGYTDLGTDTILNVTDGTTNTVVREELDFHTIKAGINFRF